jgi:Pyruvate/2-oxoacid:ferredoxin oxidoreductase delta subunit
MRPYNPPSAIPTFRYRNPPMPGNTINGLGESEKRRPRKVFHRSPMGAPDREPAAWSALDFHFNMISGIGTPLFGLAVLRHVLMNRWQLRRANGPVAPRPVAEGDAAANAARVRNQIKRRYGSALVGFTRLTDDDLYEDESVPYLYAVCIGMPMRREEMVFAPRARADVEVLRSYREIAKVAVETSEFIRAMGWPAKAYGETKSTEVLHIPLAIRAGIGQLGKHGSMICKEYGSNFRLATVLTDLPLAEDRPVDIGVDDLCLKCSRCVQDCPPRAISDTKQLVRGETKWYVDFDKCVPYFAETAGCAICIEVCPWSEPGRGPGLSDKLLAKRGARSGGPNG